LGTPLFFLLGNLSIYNEAIIWALAWAMAALLFAWLSQRQNGRSVTLLLVAFSLCAPAALLSRATFGVPLVMIALLLGFPLLREKRLGPFLALLLPLGAGLVFYLFLSYARFGNFIGIGYDHYINSVHREFTHKYGMFSLQRVPYALADYFGPRFPTIQAQAPFLKGDRHFFLQPQLYSLSNSETYLPVPFAASWLLAGAILGIACLLRKGCSDWFERGAAVSFGLQAIGILCFYALAQRYSVELYPFLIFCFLVFLRHSQLLLARSYRVIIGLVAVSITVNSLATISWLADADQNVQPETRAIWNRTKRPLKRARERSDQIVITALQKRF
jgi:hypothetical protein